MQHQPNQPNQLKFTDPYIQWVQNVGREDFDYDLGSSGLSMDWDWREWGIDVATIPADGSNWQGHEPLRARVASQLGVDTSRVMLASGTSGANALVVGTIVRPGDRVLCESPIYTSLENLVRGFGGVVEHVARDEARGWQFDLDDLDTRLAGCRMCFITNPHNPTGQVLAPETLASIAALCDRHGVILVVDEVYREFPSEHPMPSAVDAGGNVVVTSSMTKAYGLGGLRMGWIAGPADLMQDVFETNRVMMGRGSVPGEWLVEQVLANDAKFAALRSDIAARVETNRTLAVEFVESFRHLGWTPPTVGICGLLRLPAGVSGRQMADRCRDEARVYVVPGEFFLAPGCIRLSFGAPTEQVRAGIERVRPVFEKTDAEALEAENQQRGAIG